MEIDKPGGSIYYIFVTAMVPAAGVIPQVRSEAGLVVNARKHCQQHLVALFTLSVSTLSGGSHCSSCERTAGKEDGAGHVRRMPV